jgi:hypothetical protein
MRKGSGLFLVHSSGAAVSADVANQRTTSVLRKPDRVAQVLRNAKLDASACQFSCCDS